MSGSGGGFGELAHAERSDTTATVEAVSTAFEIGRMLMLLLY
jgi:hypothetical protein